MSLRDIIRHTAEGHGLNVGDLTGRNRSRKLVRARQEAMWRARQVKRPDGRNRYSFPQIGRALNRDHSTIVHGAAAHRDRLSEHTANIHHHLSNAAQRNDPGTAKHLRVTP
jgi:chromosomal replication initiation ATPase DnaA